MLNHTMVDIYVDGYCIGVGGYTDANDYMLMRNAIETECRKNGMKANIIVMIPKE